MLDSQAKRLRVPIYYCNSVGGNDQLVFDGHSLALSADGTHSRVFAGFADDAKVENGMLTLSDRPGIGFEAQNTLYAALKKLA
jgi:predicted amidohydrolase